MIIPCRSLPHCPAGCATAVHVHIAPNYRLCTRSTTNGLQHVDHQRPERIFCTERIARSLRPLESGGEHRLVGDGQHDAFDCLVVCMPILSKHEAQHSAYQQCRRETDTKTYIARGAVELASLDARQDLSRWAMRGGHSEALRRTVWPRGPGRPRRRHSLIAAVLSSVEISRVLFDL